MCEETDKRNGGEIAGGKPHAQVPLWPLWQAVSAAAAEQAALEAQLQEVRSEHQRQLQARRPSLPTT